VALARIHGFIVEDNPAEWNHQNDEKTQNFKTSPLSPNTGGENIEKKEHVDQAAGQEGKGLQEIAGIWMISEEPGFYVCERKKHRPNSAFISMIGRATRNAKSDGDCEKTQNIEEESNPEHGRLIFCSQGRGFASLYWLFLSGEVSVKSFKNRSSFKNLR